MKINHIMGILTSFFIAMVVIPSIIKISIVKNLVDLPTSRKMHIAATPNLGGIAIFAGFIISYTFWNSYLSDLQLHFLIPSSLLLFFLGVKDDIFGVAPLKKLVVQIFAAMIVVHLGKIQITSFYGFLGIFQLPIEVSYLVSIIFIVGLTNAFNMIDGVDLLAGILATILLITLGNWYYHNNYFPYSMISFCLLGGIIGFIFFNFPPAKIFMGDTGSLVIGFISSVLTVKFLEFNTIAGQIESTKIPMIVLGVLIIPVYDVFQVTVRRLLKRQSPLKPDRNHIHHILLDLGLSPFKVSLSIITYSLLVLYFAHHTNEIIHYFNIESKVLTKMILFVFGLTTIVLGILLILRRRKFNIPVLTFSSHENK